MGEFAPSRDKASYPRSPHAKAHVGPGPSQVPRRALPVAQRPARAHRSVLGQYAAHLRAEISRCLLDRRSR